MMDGEAQTGFSHELHVRGATPVSGQERPVKQSASEEYVPVALDRAAACGTYRKAPIGRRDGYDNTVTWDRFHLHLEMQAG